MANDELFNLLVHITEDALIGWWLTVQLRVIV